MKKNSFLLFLLLPLAGQAQEKPTLNTTHSKTIEVQSAGVLDNQSTIADPIIRPKNELPISTKTNPDASNSCALAGLAAAPSVSL